MDAQFFSLAEVAKSVNKRPHQVVYAITSGLLPDTANRIAGKRAFTVEELEIIREHFAVRSKKESGK